MRNLMLVCLSALLMVGAARAGQDTEAVTEAVTEAGTGEAPAPEVVQPVIVPPDPWEIIHVAREFGTAEVTNDSLRDPLITAEISGQPYRISFYGCWLGRACKTILFEADLGREDWTPKARELARWNGRALFGRAWLRGDGRAALDHPLAMPTGLPKESLRATFEAWHEALDDYRDFLDF